MKMHVGKGEISVIKGDIADQSTDAVVNAANNHLWMGGAVIEQEAMAKGPIEIGSAVSTSAGALKARRVIHAAVMGQDLHTEPEFIRKATVSSLKVAEQEGCVSISLPAFGTGVGGFSLYHCASLMIGVAIEFMITSKVLKEVRFVLFDDEAREVFEKELKHRFTAHGH